MLIHRPVDEHFPLKGAPFLEDYIRIEGVSKHFGPVKALSDVSFSIARGEIHAIVGENGAGKSTLLRILSGELKPDSGRVTIADNDITELGVSLHRKVGMVHQELAIFNNLTVAENIYPNLILKRNAAIVKYRNIVKKTEEQLKLFGVDIDPSELLENLSVAEQQIVEILRVISMLPEIVILDEPTSSLSRNEVDSLNAILFKLRERKVTILYISHRISDVLRISDRLTVLKNGLFVGTLPNLSIAQADVIKLMVGKDVDSFYDFSGRQRFTRRSKIEKPVLELKNVSKAKSVQDISLEVFPNEILGIFGLEGSGTIALSRLLFGLDGVDEGEIRLTEDSRNRIDPMSMILNGVVYLSGDRKKYGLFPQLSAFDNIACPNLRRFSRHGIIRKDFIAHDTEVFIRRFNIAISSGRARVATMSGGNQQKLMLSICLSTNPRMIILNEPTRGIDVGAKSEIYKLINEISTNVAIVVFSSELPELLALCERIVIMRNRRISGELSSAQFDEELIMSLAAGESQKA